MYISNLMEKSIGLQKANWLKHGIGADECLTRQKIKYILDPIIYYHFLHSFLHILAKTSLCF